MNQTVNVTEIATLHQDSIIRWKTGIMQLMQTNFLRLVEENHSFNYRLWHAEDKARLEDEKIVYLAKRDIDFCNQQRNNRMEAMDEWLFQHLYPAEPTACPVHSETPGMMIDRLSILALKAYHMHLQTQREEITTAHQQNCQHKLEIIIKQQQQLLACLAELLTEVQLQQRTFRLYHQFKMYNDPNLNPELYQNKES